MLELSTILTIISIALTVFIGIYAYVSPANETKKEHDRRRWCMGISGGIIVICQIWLMILNDQKAKDRNLKDERYKTHTDSLNFALQDKTEKFIKSNQPIIKANTVHTTINNLKSPSILLQGILGENGLVLSTDKSHYTYYISSFDATSKKVNLFSSFVFSNDLSDFVYDSKIKIVDNATIPENADLTGKLYKEENTKKYSCFIMWLRGTYKKDDRSKPIDFNKVVLYNNTTNVLYPLSGETKTDVIKFIEKNEKKTYQ